MAKEIEVFMQVRRIITRRNGQVETTVRAGQMWVRMGDAPPPNHVFAEFPDGVLGSYRVVEVES